MVSGNITVYNSSGYMGQRMIMDNGKCENSEIKENLFIKISLSDS